MNFLRHAELRNTWTFTGGASQSSPEQEAKSGCSISSGDKTKGSSPWQEQRGLWEEHEDRTLLDRNDGLTVSFCVFLRRPRPPAVPSAPPAAVPPRPAPRPPPAACRLASCRAPAPARAPAPSTPCSVTHADFICFIKMFIQMNILIVNL